MVVEETVGWLDGWMVVGWLDDWMVGWLDGWMVGWLDDFFSRCFFTVSLLYLPQLPAYHFLFLPRSEIDGTSEARDGTTATKDEKHQDVDVEKVGGKRQSKRPSIARQSKKGGQ
jgi:hypothetical protein